MHFFSIDDKWRYANVLSALHIISCLISPFYMHFLLALLFASILLHDNRHRQVLKIGDKMHAREWWCSLKWAASLNNRSFGLAKGDITLSAWMHLVKGEIWQPFSGNVVFTIPPCKRAVTAPCNLQRCHSIWSGQFLIRSYDTITNTWYYKEGIFSTFQTSIHLSIKIWMRRLFLGYLIAISEIAFKAPNCSSSSCCCLYK